jgi:hypothetical protein
MTLPALVVAWAILAAGLFGDKTTLAVAWFIAACTLFHFHIPANPLNFINYWRDRWTPEGGINSRAHNSGRLPKISPQQVERAYKGIISWKADGKSRPYKSMDRMATDCPAVKKVLEETGITIKHLVRLIKKAHPHFQYKQLKVTWKMTDDLKAERLHVCTGLLAEYADMLHRMVFMDQKTVFMWEQEVCGWVDTTVEYSFEGIKPAKHGRQTIRLKYYSAVHSKLGAFFLRFYTGTTGMTCRHDGYHFKVGSSYKELSATPCHHMCHSFSQLGSPSSMNNAWRLDVLIDHQPQHTPTLWQSHILACMVLEQPCSQAAVTVVGLADHPLVMPLPLHLNQKPIRSIHNRHCHIPLFYVYAYALPLTHLDPHRQGEAAALTTVLLNERLLLTQIIQHPLPLAAFL